MLDVARVYLSTATEDRSGEDRSLVVVHVNAELLGEQTRKPQAPEPTDVPDANVPAGTSGNPEPGDPSTDNDSLDPEAAELMTAKTELPQPAQVPDADVPAGTPDKTAPTCHIDGVGGIEPETARKLSCDADLLGAIVDAHGEVLALGRTRRLVTRAQRQALIIRDHGMCQFTGCHQTRHLQAHHIIHWFDGGPTDLANLILLCQRHHTVVHEGGMIIQRSSNPAPSARRWEFLRHERRSEVRWRDGSEKQWDRTTPVTAIATGH
ncbi:MAG: HNH endonuclease signature motif containing protein [Microlunatus sp.]